jgi:serine/threonine protein kinase
MDIKPKNILVKDMGQRGIRQAGATKSHARYKVIIADFGISRSYSSTTESETESPTSFTRAYAAPEVISQAPRGFSADIFSLGCVFLEVLAVLADISLTPTKTEFTHSSSNWQDLLDIRTSNAEGDTSYQANLSLVRGWSLGVCEKLQRSLDLVTDTELKVGVPFGRMLDPDPSQRPPASELVQRFGDVGLLQSCRCDHTPDPYQAAES